MKNLLLLFLLAVMLPSAFSGRRMKRQTGVWGSWGEWGKCSRSCGGGVSVRQRHCYFQRTESASSCIGPTRSYRSCNIQSCPEGSRDFRAEQCAEFDGTEFQGKKYKWLPYYGAPNKCELNCIPKGENFYYRHKETVIDGTTCEPGKRDICVEGVCQAVGCDNILESTKKEDKCLQCGGDNSTCYDVKGTFEVPNLPKGYNQIFIIPVGATSIQIKEVMPSRNFIAVKNVQGDYYLNGHWTIDFSRTLHIASTVMHYDRGSEGDLAPELLHARGPTTEPLVIELISQEPNPGVQYEYYLPMHRQTTSYSWSYSSWSECSSECGGDNLANERNKPSFNWWKTGEWGPCSATCGGGTQTRSVYCVAFDGQNSQGVVDNAECMAFAQQPHSSQPCNRRQCATWSTGPWSECSASCGEGVQTRTVTCRTQHGSQAQDFACLMEPKPPATQPCLKENCIQEVGWHVGDWGLCSKSCNSGIRTRQVICADGDSKFYSADICKAIQPQKPATLGSCNMQPCYLPQQVPSMQDTMGYDISRQSLLTRYNPNSPPTGSEFCLFGFLVMVGLKQGMKDPSFLPFSCSFHGLPEFLESGINYRLFTPVENYMYGCCPDGVSAARGPNNMGCPQYDSDVHMRRNQPAAAVPTASQALSQQHPSGECRSSVYGCCFDNVASASGPEGEGCLNRPNYPYPVMCLLPSAHGPCANWTTRWYFVTVVGKCNRFWYGGCHGNKNSFASEEECMRVCHSSVGISPLEHQPSSGTGTLQQQDTGSRFHMDTAQGKQQSLPGESSSHGQEGRAYGASHRTQNRHGENYWRRQVLPETLQRSSVMESQQWGTQQSRLKSLSQLHLTGETAVPGPSQKQSSGGQQVLPREGKQWYKASGTDASMTEGFGHQVSADSFPAQNLHRATVEEAKPSLVTAIMGQNIQLVCKASLSPFSRVEWVKDGRPVSSDRLRMDKSEPSVVEAKVGERVRLPCTVEASPALTIEWQKDGQPLSPPRHRQQSDGALVISRVSSEDAGFFTCIASNGRDQDQRQVLLRPLATVNHIVDLSRECVDQPHLANCGLIVQAQLCGNEYYASFCCASCSRYQPHASPPHRSG
ncbi:hypothetical protein CIB84_000033 [Bambusicola thoracicus]|uniref:Papilin n=1 Tax=Bambusicola thoracicus TaxID=9083 RepID=A0A2P4TIN8_BAMTH|nr:hypothetical protein CIB84_000033 [Bambusicola thoracicus]